MTTHSKPISFVLTMMLALVAGVGASFAISGCSEKPAPDPDAGNPDASAPAVLAVKLHKDGCASCEAIQPHIDAAKKIVGDRPVEFLTLDLGTDESRAAAAKTARSLGIEAIFEAHKGKTGFVLLIDMKDHTVIQKLTKDEDETAWTGAFDALPATPADGPESGGDAESSEG